ARRAKDGARVQQQRQHVQHHARADHGHVQVEAPEQALQRRAIAEHARRRAAAVRAHRLVHVHELPAPGTHHRTAALAHGTEHTRRSASAAKPARTLHDAMRDARDAAGRRQFSRSRLGRFQGVVATLRAFTRWRAVCSSPGVTHLGDCTVTAPVFHALVFWLPAFLFSTTVHEAAHAWAALRLGDPTAFRQGQVSLSPWPHVRRSPIGMLVVPVLTSLTQGWTMGWASAPYDPRWADRHPRRAALMALAGPLGNLAIALAAFALLRAGLAFGVFEAPHTLSVQHLVNSALPADRLLASDFLAEGLSVLLALNAL